MFTPNGIPLTVVLLLFGAAIVPVPVHSPVSPKPNTLAFKVPLPLHTSGVEVVGLELDGVLLVTTTKSSAEQLPFNTVHLNVYTPPLNPVTSLLVEFGVTIVTGLPPCKLHVPTPTVGVMAPKFILVLHVSMSMPASANTPLLVILTSSNEVQPSAAEVTVHLNTFTPLCKLFTRVLY